MVLLFKRIMNSTLSYHLYYSIPVTDNIRHIIIITSLTLSFSYAFASIPLSNITQFSSMFIFSTKPFIIFLFTTFFLSILSTFFLTQSNVHNYSSLSTTTSLNSLHQSTTHQVWPELEFSWRLVLATVIGFLGSAFGTVGGVGGGGIFVPMLTLIIGFDTKSAAAFSKCMIMGASASSVWYNLRVSHPTKEVPILDYDLALLFQPMLMLGITLGVSLSVVFPYWLITVLIIILFIGLTINSKVYYKYESYKSDFEFITT
ncbi:putative transmembrane protein TauE [Lupinus albus]|uniref:Putative transmembrane protein TauE n=1 Tax=Lupinus albus TaxID=3870 RepID=A0A6A4NDR7_LUPAL|nr:putative transmembrane protein TauE [Lupinus albus]